MEVWTCRVGMFKSVTNAWHVIDFDRFGQDVLSGSHDFGGVLCAALGRDQVHIVRDQYLSLDRRKTSPAPSGHRCGKVKDGMRGEALPSCLYSGLRRNDGMGAGVMGRSAVQVFIEIAPLGVVGLDEAELPGALPFLDLLFPSNR